MAVEATRRSIAPLKQRQWVFGFDEREVIHTMNEKELRILLASGETETVEFKERLNESFYRSISAFANTRGGTILLGVDKEGNITGVDSSSRFLKGLANRIVNKISVYPQIEVMDIKQKRVLAVKVARAGWLVSYGGRHYERIGNTTREMNRQKLRALLLRGESWDSIPDDFSPKEIDPAAVDHFVHLAVEKNRLTDVSLSEAPEGVLEKLGLIADRKLRNGAILPFGKDPQRRQS